MNLYKIQERLKEIPIETIISYVNGMNPEVPPYLALAELNRREKYQREDAEEPNESVKERIENKALDSAVKEMTALQARQQQASQQMQEEMSEPTEQIPPGVPQPKAPEGTRTLASGGITRLPVKDMFNFNGGGIVAFAEGGTDKKKTNPKQMLPPPDDFMKLAKDAIDKEIVMPPDPMEMLEKAKQKDPTLRGPAGAGYEAVLKKIAEQDVRNRQAFEQREKDAGLRGISKALIAAGEATRGGGGIGALAGGYGKSRVEEGEAASERRAKQEAAVREQDLNMAKIGAEIENMRRAEARGDVTAAYTHKAKIAELQADIQKNRVSGFAELARTQQTGKYYDFLKGQAGLQSKPEFVKLAEYFKQRNPNLTDQEAYDMAAKYSRQGIAGEYALDKNTQQIIQRIQEKYRPQMLATQNNPKARAEVEKLIQAEIARAIGEGGGIPGGGGGVDTSRFKITEEQK